MTTSIARAVTVAVLVVAQGCLVKFKCDGRPDLLPTAGNKAAGGSSADRRVGEGFGPKPVTGKQPPSRLIARDGTSCVVSEEKFEATTLGTSIWCNWIDG